MYGGGVGANGLYVADVDLRGESRDKLKIAVTSAYNVWRVNADEFESRGGVGAGTEI